MKALNMEIHGEKKQTHEIQLNYYLEKNLMF